MSRFSFSLVLVTLLACGKSADDKSESGADSGTSVETGESASPPVDLDEDGFTSDEDCDDSNADIHPDATEICNDIDDNCDGLVDDEDSALDMDTQTAWYHDYDGDGYGDESDIVYACAAPNNYVAESVSGFDCDDTDPRYQPGAAEADCTDPNDYNCDGSVGYADDDGDGFAACEDCDDALFAINADAVEICDGIDNDCDGWVDDVDPDVAGAATWYGDADGDTYGGQQFTAIACLAPQGYVDNSDDCDDLNPSTYPGATETCDESDNDCDGTVDEDVQKTWYADADNDGYGDATTTLDACTAPTGYVWDNTDCDDTSATTNPASYEHCDGTDNNCDGVVDDGSALEASAWYADTDTDGFGDSSTIESSCSQPSGYVADDTDCDDTSSSIYPGADEYCDSVDTDCDGTLDEAAALDASTWYADTDTDGFGDSSSIELGCSQPSGYVADDTDCDDTSSSIYPGASETCDDVDSDCDGDFVDSGENDCHALATCTADSSGVNYTCECNTGYTGDGINVCDTGYFPGSNLLSSTDETQLNQWANTVGHTWTLCYQKSIDGNSSTTFHTNCDSYSNTISVVELNTGVLIGGYAGTSWSGSGYQFDTSNFLFSLTRGYQIMAGTGISTTGQYAQNNSYGPTFGGGHDLFIDNTMSVGYCNLGFSYACQSGTYSSSTCHNDFCGSYDSWTITELEVWGR
jgi:hypothetical protein